VVGAPEVSGSIRPRGTRDNLWLLGQFSQNGPRKTERAVKIEKRANGCEGGCWSRQRGRAVDGVVFDKIPYRLLFPPGTDRANSAAKPDWYMDHHAAAETLVLRSKQ
jgi:hypothetical protein